MKTHGRREGERGQRDEGVVKLLIESAGRDGISEKEAETGGWIEIAD